MSANNLIPAGGRADAVRLKHPDDEPLFTWWVYWAEVWGAVNKGRRLDHIWIYENLKPAVQAAEVFEDARSWGPPSDHVPVIVTLDAAHAPRGLGGTRRAPSPGFAH